jgi:hypothetical protein
VKLHAKAAAMKRFVLVLALTVAGMPQALAQRPFDGTDAAVVRSGTVEFEFGYLGLLRAGREKSLLSPALVVNVGLPSGGELSVQGRLRTRLGGAAAGPGTALEDTAVSVKHVFRKGVLQGAQGPSIASECGVLLPSAAGERTGMQCTGIASQRLFQATLHFNGALARSREHQWERRFGVIAEGPSFGPVKPVFEGQVGWASDGVRTRSALAGFILSAADNLTFDLGLRTAKVGMTRVSELRAGLTWRPR